MRHTKYFRIALYISFSLILATFHYSCNDKKEGSESQTVNKDIADSIPVITIKKDSLTIITPGQDSVPLPQKYTAGQPKIVPTNTNIHPVPEIKPIPAGKPNIIRVVQTHGRVSQPDDTLNRIYSFTPALSEVEVNPATGDTLHALEAIPINFDSVPVITAGIPEVTIAKDPYIRDQNPQNFSSFSKLQGLKHDVIRCMLQDRTGNLWFGTSGGGVSKYDGDHVVASNTIENKQSVRESFTHFTEKEGLSNNYVFGMALDKNDNLWFGTRFGLSKLPALKRAKLEEIFKKNIGKDGRPSVPTNEVFFKTYGYYDGFLGIGVNGGNTGKNVYEASDGTIWIAANDRLTAYHPEGYVPDTIPPNVQLTGIELFGENIQWVNLIGGYAGSNGRSTLRSAKDTSFTLNNGIEVASETENGVLICGKDGTFEWVNRGFERLYGLTLEEYTAKHGKTIYETSSNPGFQQVVNEAVEHSSSITYNSQFTKETGHTIWMQTTLTPIFDDDGSLKKLVAIESDITKIKEAEEEIRHQKEHIEEIHREVTDSINYAKRIQTSALPDLSPVKKSLSDIFVLFKPKDVVSGDFYWYAEVENQIVLTVADCTGHGVPGAFMSMMGMSMLKEIVVKEYVTQPDVILRKMRKEVIKALGQKGEPGDTSTSLSVRDGMDMSLCSINKETFELQWSGANNPLWIIRDRDVKTMHASSPHSNPDELILMEVKPDKMPIAIYEKMDRFTLHEINLNRGDIIYLIGDGYPDQFGGPKGKKFMSKKLKELLLEISSKPMKEQHEILENTIMAWMNNHQEKYEQTDDITIMGIKI